MQVFRINFRGLRALGISLSLHERVKYSLNRKYVFALAFIPAQIFNFWRGVLANEYKIENMSITKFKSLLLICAPSLQELEIKKIAAEYGIDSKNTLDYFEIFPEKKQISIDKIRELKGHIYQKPIKSKVKFVAVKDADLLTLEAQNALLKLLEEPPAHAVIVLATGSGQKLLPTIRSRTVEIDIRTQKKHLSKIFEFEGANFDESITSLSEIENSKAWLNEQIESNYQRLLFQINKNDPKGISETAKRIEDLCYCKKLIEANVGAKFVLFNLLLS